MAETAISGLRAAHKTKHCKHCKTSFSAQRIGQIACSADCAIALAKKSSQKLRRSLEKHEKKQDRAKRDAIKTRAQWMREAQAAFNAWVRARDADEPCISCGRHHMGQWHAGHYLSVGANPALRFDPANVHKQCAPCNTYLSGNAVHFRAGLMARYGPELVAWLESPRGARKYTIDELKEIKAMYTTELKKIRRKE